VFNWQKVAKTFDVKFREAINILYANLMHQIDDAQSVCCLDQA